jgi:O-antigen ligase
MIALAKRLLLLLVFALPLMKPAVHRPIIAADLLFVPLGLLWLAAVVLGKRRLQWHKAYWVLILYLASLATSLFVTSNVPQSLFKLATQVYLLGMALLTADLVESADDARKLIHAWLAGTAVVVAVATVGLAAFLVAPHGALYSYVRFSFGTLPVGPYPRLSSTFANGNMLCNYLTVSLGLLLGAYALGWVSRRTSLLLLASLLVTALFTLSPGLGGILLVAGLWLWLAWRRSFPVRARLVLAAALAGGVAFVAAMTVTPIIHPTAPYLIAIPGTHWTLAPAGRMLTWTAAVRAFLQHPWLGHGIGVDAVSVLYLTPSGELQTLTDAHNSFLNIAAQCGLVGLAGLLLPIGYVLVHLQPFDLRADRPDLLRVALGLSFLAAFAYEGLGGSFEDARHLWILFGMFLASVRLERTAEAGERTLIRRARRAT